MSFVAFTLAALLCCDPARAAGPDAGSFQPGHLRAVEEAPRRWSQVFGYCRRVVIHWDGDDAFRVERATSRGWRTVDRRARSGWTSPRLPRGTPFRLVDGDGRPSPSVVAPAVGSPADLAALDAPGNLLLGHQVVDLELDGRGRPWIATLDGGAAHLDPRTGRIRRVTRADGLPSDRVVAVMPDETGAWIGTAGGLARVEPTRGRALGRRAPRRWEVTSVLDMASGLPDSYVQALARDGDDLWVGTYRGLARVRDGSVRTFLQPWSVFSLGRGTDQRMWAGYEGLRGLPDGEPIEGLGSDLDVYDIEPLPGKGTLLATLQEGVVLLWEGERFPLWTGNEEDGAYALARVPGGFLAAGATGGLQAIDFGGRVGRSFHGSDGLPSEVVNEVVPDRATRSELAAWGASPRVWVGTDQGVARLDLVHGLSEVWGTVPFPAGTPITAVDVHRTVTWMAGPHGVHVAGRREPGRRARARWAAGGLVDVVRQGRTTWWVYADRVVQSRPVGRDRIHRTPYPLTDAVLAGDVLWIAGREGALRYNWKIRMFEPVSGMGKVERLRADAQGTVWAIAGGVVVSLTPDLQRRTYIQTHRPRDLWPDGQVVWVGTDNGLDLLQARTGDGLSLLRSADRRVLVPAVAADGLGGCWAATDGGQVVYLDTTLREGAVVLDLDRAEPPTIREIVPVGERGAWVLTEQGVYALRRPGW